MHKYLVNNEQEYIKLFNNLDFSIVENWLNITFGYTDGTYTSEDLEISFDTYKKNEYSIFPEYYPCVVIVNYQRLKSLACK